MKQRLLPSGLVVWQWLLPSGVVLLLRLLTSLDVSVANSIILVVSALKEAGPWLPSVVVGSCRWCLGCCTVESKL